ncbi:MAG: hypothetical protein ACRC1U_02370, partial [Vibrionaceae bacterium]
LPSASSPLFNTTTRGLLPASPTSTTASQTSAIAVGVSLSFVGVGMLIGLIYWCYAKYQEYRMHRGREVTSTWHRLHPRRRPRRDTHNAIEMQPLPTQNILAAQGGIEPLSDHRPDPQLVAFLNQLQREESGGNGAPNRYDDGNNKKKKRGGKDDKSAKKR